MKTTTIEQAKKSMSSYLEGQDYNIDTNGTGWFGEYDYYEIVTNSIMQPMLEKHDFGNPYIPYLIFSIPISENEQEFLEVLKLIDK